MSEQTYQCLRCGKTINGPQEKPSWNGCFYVCDSCRDEQGAKMVQGAALRIGGADHAEAITIPLDVEAMNREIQERARADAILDNIIEHAFNARIGSYRVPGQGWIVTVNGHRVSNTRYKYVRNRDLEIVQKVSAAMKNSKRICTLSDPQAKGLAEHVRKCILLYLQKLPNYGNPENARDLIAQMENEKVSESPQ